MLCRAKINLTLHVGGPILGGKWAGYHPVESLVVFADFGDEITFEPSNENALTIEGPFGAGLTIGPDNLITKALRACSAPPQSVRLIKRLPISSGLGGGSTNAAAVLRSFDPECRVDSAALGADVPVCRLSQTSMMEGIGERVTLVPGLGSISAVLVNPNVPVSTGAIFKNYDARNPPENPQKTARQGTLLERAMSGTNDLQEDAILKAPIIRSVLDLLNDQDGCKIARMSGSGATCFGLFEDDDAARRAAKTLAKNGWWAEATRLGDAL